MSVYSPLDRSCFIRTTDWWAGNYLANGKTFYEEYSSYSGIEEPFLSVDLWLGQEYVLVFLDDKRWYSDPRWQLIVIGIGGTGDLEYTKDFLPSQENEAIEFYEYLVTLEPITFEKVASLGMKTV